MFYLSDSIPNMKFNEISCSLDICTAIVYISSFLSSLVQWRLKNTQQDQNEKERKRERERKGKRERVMQGKYHCFCFLFSFSVSLKYPQSLSPHVQQRTIFSINSQEKKMSSIDMSFVICQGFYRLKTVHILNVAMCIISIIRTI